MSVKILAVGDVVAPRGLDYLSKHLKKLIKTTGAAFTVVNGENASQLGITPDQAEDIFAAGADVITLGNHGFNRREIFDYLDDSAYILRPANFAPQCPGRGMGVYDASFGQVKVINLIGRCNMDYGPDNPFLMVDKLLKDEPCTVTLVDFHAETSSEKLAMGYMLDGRVSAVWGTHTHVQTSDAGVLPNGTGYISDLGMTGPAVSVLGIKPEQSIAMFRGEPKSRFTAADGPCKLEGVLLDVDEKTGRCTAIQRVQVS